MEISWLVMPSFTPSFRISMIWSAWLSNFKYLWIMSWQSFKLSIPAQSASLSRSWWTPSIKLTANKNLKISSQKNHLKLSWTFQLPFVFIAINESLEFGLEQPDVQPFRVGQVGVSVQDILGPFQKLFALFQVICKPFCGVLFQFIVVFFISHLQ